MQSTLHDSHKPLCKCFPTQPALWRRKNRCPANSRGRSTDPYLCRAYRHLSEYSLTFDLNPKVIEIPFACLDIRLKVLFEWSILK